MYQHQHLPRLSVVISEATAPSLLIINLVLIFLTKLENHNCRIAVFSVSGSIKCVGVFQWLHICVCQCFKHCLLSERL